MELAFAVHTPPEYVQAPEFSYLTSWVRERLDAAIAPGRAVDADPRRPAESAEGRPLLVADCRTLIGAPSLRRMVGALEAGASAVVPELLADTGLAAERPLYTLRAFELLEAERLGAGGPPPAPPRTPLPALLLAPGAAPQDADARRLLEATAPGGGRAMGAEPVVAGLCHRFIDYYGELRDDVLPFLPDGCREVLEVGCGRGTTGAWLEERTGCRVTGIELNPVVARAAAGRLHRVVAGDFLEVAERLRSDGQGATAAPPYDAVVGFELFEHLTDQDAFLEAARSLLRPGGRIVLSVPNVGHHAVVADLLAGRWDYLPVGLLCYTHYRFFTRRTLEDWLRRAGFRHVELVPQRTELPAAFDPGPFGAAGLELDRDSLSTKGFYAVIENR